MVPESVEQKERRSTGSSISYIPLTWSVVTLITRSHSSRMTELPNRARSSLMKCGEALIKGPHEALCSLLVTSIGQTVIE